MSYRSLAGDCERGRVPPCRLRRQSPTGPEVTLGRLQCCSPSLREKNQARNLVLSIVEPQKGDEGGRRGRTGLWPRVAALQHGRGRMAENRCKDNGKNNRLRKKKKGEKIKQKAPPSQKPSEGGIFEGASKRRCGAHRAVEVGGGVGVGCCSLLWGGPFAWGAGGPSLWNERSLVTRSPRQRPAPLYPRLPPALPALSCRSSCPLYGGSSRKPRRGRSGPPLPASPRGPVTAARPGAAGIVTPICQKAEDAP